MNATFKADLGFFTIEKAALHHCGINGAIH